MKRRAWTTPMLLLAGGCLPGPETATLVPCSPFADQGFRPAEVRQVVDAPGTKEASDRVCAVGGQIIAANQQIGFRPRFITTSSPLEESFHRGTRDVFITEGLVRRCETDAQLAAVLCLELGKMVAEREAFSEPLTRLKGETAPIDMEVGNDVSSGFGSPDGTRRMELSKYVEEPRHQPEAPPPAPEALAREYLRRSGFAPAEPATRQPETTKQVYEKAFRFTW
jgi:hypothetical protein